MRPGDVVTYYYTGRGGYGYAHGGHDMPARALVLAVGPVRVQIRLVRIERGRGVVRFLPETRWVSQNKCVKR